MSKDSSNIGLKEQLRALVAEIAEKDEIPDGASFKDLGIDSMMGVEIVAAIERQYQIKVLDAAEMGVAQVLTPAAIRGFAPGFPARVASEDEALASAVVDLLRNVDAARELGVASRQHAHDRYSTRAWKDEVSRLIC